MSWCRCVCNVCWKTANLPPPGKNLDGKNTWGHCLYCEWRPSTLAATHPVQRVGRFVRAGDVFIPWSGRR